MSNILFCEKLVFICFDPRIDNKKKEEVKFFLMEEGFEFSLQINFTVVVLNDGKLVATGSLEDYVLKCFYIKKECRNMGISNKIVKLLTEKAFENNRTHLFIYTKPENTDFFKGLGYHKVLEILNLVVLLENKKNGFLNYLNSLKKYKTLCKNVSSIVVNCNPFTKGHLFLIEKAARENDIVHLFIVTEDKSEFSLQDRINMVKKGTNHLKNIIIHLGDKYIISSATFPTYFIKDKHDIEKTYGYLDLTLFGKYIAKALNIKTRYVGEEPLSTITRSYNNYMKKILPHYGIKVIEVPRVKEEEKFISASLVRKLLHKNKMSEVRKFVPQTTFEYLVKLTNDKGKI